MLCGYYRYCFWLFSAASLLLIPGVHIVAARGKISVVHVMEQGNVRFVAVVGKSTLPVGIRNVRYVGGVRNATSVAAMGKKGHVLIAEGKEIYR